MEEPSVLTINEVAAWLRVHRATIYRMLKRGELPCFRVGSDYRFSRAEVIKWIAAHGEKMG